MSSTCVCTMHYVHPHPVPCQSRQTSCTLYTQGKNETEHITEGDVLGQFTYSIDSTPIQEFTVKDVSSVHCNTIYHNIVEPSSTFYHHVPFLPHYRMARHTLTFSLTSSPTMAMSSTHVSTVWGCTDIQWTQLITRHSLHTFMCYYISS